jgi:hypothetical protein
MPLRTKLVRVTATSLLSRLKSEVGAQIVESYYIEARTFQHGVNFRKYLDDGDKIRLNTIPFIVVNQSTVFGRLMQRW